MSPNKNYTAGRAFEYKRKKYWTEQGYDVIRASGSHGPYDLVALRAGTPTLAIQCKRCTKESEANSLLREFRKNPPLAPNKYFHQRMEVQVKGSSEILSVEV